ncbi:Vacuolar sorting protein VPS1, dynamin [Pseudoloma neurophilia]|uniref:Vacuolar sorting protein VPS1, dynamin n=1 Tax=Pseudoloma neurophilia TaxID=146866 RepID=A0A0R0LV42_9MICR|nr:Vacuolar sorting protein VPS1, dynamin [Pseudoloma neurophilia]
MSANSSMALLIERMNTLSDILTDSNLSNTIDLPQIVVIGSQSSGKSSVLENIVGRDFLPRGIGIVTRRPLILQLIYRKGKDHAIFNHKDKVFFDFEEVKSEILNETNRSIKNKYDVSEKPITLKLYSENVMTLTLIDLPGLVKVPTNDQPKNIVSKIEEISKTYINNKNAIIIAVSAATSDITSSDSLQLAKTVDRNYERTIGILTKVDLMDKETDVIDILAGKLVSLKMGFIPVVNRGQKEIKSGKLISEALKDEEKFFATHPAYKQNSTYCGTAYLRTKLTTILHDHIRKTIPELIDRTNQMIIKTTTELDEIGQFNLAPKETVLKVINDVCKKMQMSVYGQSGLYGQNETALSLDSLHLNTNNELKGGARLSYTLYTSFPSFMNNITPLSHSDETIRTLMLNAAGSSGSLFFSQSAFEMLSKQSVNLFRPHCLKLVNVIFSEIVRMMYNNVNSRFPKLNDRVASSLVDLFKNNSEKTVSLVQAILELNVECISTKHPDFVKIEELGIYDSSDKKQKISHKTEKSNPIAFDKIPNILRVQNDLTDSEQSEITLIKSLVLSYFDITRKIILDQIPKAILTNLIKKSLNGMQEHLFLTIYESEDVEKLCEEGDDVKEAREKLRITLSAMRKAYDLMCSL